MTHEAHAQMRTVEIYNRRGQAATRRAEQTFLTERQRHEGIPNAAQRVHLHVKRIRVSEAII